MRAELLQLAALCAAFWTAALLYRGDRPVRFVAALGFGAVLAHAGFALLHLPAVIAPSALAAAWLVTAALWGVAGELRVRDRLALARRSWPAAVIGCLACAGAPAQDVGRVAAAAPTDASASASDNYLELVAVRDEFKDTYLMHWPLRKMPLAVYLPQPPEGLFEDPDGVFEAVRSGVLAWTDVAAPGVPGFRFVAAHADADVPIAWAEEPDGDWYIAFCSYAVRPRRNLFDVEQILVTGRWGDGRLASTDEIYQVILHEMGHALGLLGHSDDTRDVMYPSASRREGRGLSDRDRNTLRELYARGNRQIRGRRGSPD